MPYPGHTDGQSPNSTHPGPSELQMAFPTHEGESLEPRPLPPPLCPAPASVLVLLSHELMKNSSPPTSAHTPRKHTCLTPGGPAFEGSEFFGLLKKAAVLTCVWVRVWVRDWSSRTRVSGDTPMGVFVPCAHCDHIRQSGQAGGAPSTGQQERQRSRRRPGCGLGGPSQARDRPRPHLQGGQDSQGSVVVLTGRSQGLGSRAFSFCGQAGPGRQNAKNVVHRCPWHCAYSCVLVRMCAHAACVRTGLGNADIGQLTLDPSPQDPCPNSTGPAARRSLAPGLALASG